MCRYLTSLSPAVEATPGEPWEEKTIQINRAGAEKLLYCTILRRSCAKAENPNVDRESNQTEKPGRVEEWRE